VAGVRRPTRRARGVSAALALVGLQVLAYAPFYFDGNYPGGGARFFAEVLPVEHVLVVLAVVSARPERFVRAAGVVLALALVGFGVHAAFDHGKLRDRDGGRPMFEPDVLARANVSAALVFVDTDHGFAIGHDPGVRSPRSGVVVARLRGDDRDRLLFDALDRPPTYQYRLGPGEPALVPWSPPPPGETLRFEAEAEWPALDQQGGFAEPVQADPCASQGRVLAIVPWPLHEHALVTIEVPVPETGRYSVSLRTYRDVRIPGFADVEQANLVEARLGTTTWAWRPTGNGCVDLDPKEIDLTAPAARLSIATHEGAVALDKISLRRSK
jgi:hypothetical protein